MLNNGGQRFDDTMKKTVVKTDAGLSESFDMNVGLHQGSVLSPLLSWMLSPMRQEVVCLPSCCMLMTLYLWHQQWSSLVDVWLNGEIAFSLVADSFRCM